MSFWNTFKEMFSSKNTLVDQFRDIIAADEPVVEVKVKKPRKPRAKKQ